MLLNIKNKFLFNIKFTILMIISIFIFQNSIKNSYSQTLDSRLYNWEIYEYKNDDEEFKKCFIINFPINSDTNDTAREKPYLIITRYQKNRSEEIAIYGGFDYKFSSHIHIMIDNIQFHLKTKKDMAWTENKSEDINIIETMLNSSTIKVRSDSALGFYAVDEYKLKGITKAYKRMREICG
jgi:hypothetical protein